MKFLLFAGMGILLASCSAQHPEGSFGYDLNFLEKYQDVILLKENKGKSQLILLPELQGRVVSSTARGLEGNSYGWMHHGLFASGEFEEHFSTFGGEERFWMGPEGGQYSIFFEKGSDFIFDNWFTPKEIDTEAFEVVSQTDKEASFQKKMHLVNYKGFEFDIEVNRTVRIFNKNQVEEDLAIKLNENIDFVGYQSNNEIVNTGTEAWSKETGLLSIWILGMFMPSENTTVILPYRDSLVLNTSYFGSIPPERLSITDKHVMFKGNGSYRFKLGLPPQNIMPYVGSYDANNQMLTIVGYSFNEEGDYVNSLWSLQDNPYQGDVVNSYNDGPLENGGQLGPFYELESSSATRELNPGESIKHIHKTYHFEGSFEALNVISKQLLNKDLNDLLPVKSADHKVYVPIQENNFKWIYKPAGDLFSGPDTEYLKEGLCYDEWVANDYTFVKDEDGLWHIPGITHPLVESDPLSKGIHDGEYKSFHAISLAASFNETLEEAHYTDLPKVLPPGERPGEILANHAPYIVKKDGLYQMVYGHSPIRLAVSQDLSSWEPKGNLFTDTNFVCAWDGTWDEKELTILNVHAPEVFQYEDGQWYISSVEWPNRGVSVDKISWVEQ